MIREIKLKAFARGNIVDVVSIDFINKYITWDDNQYDRCYPPNKCFEIESFEEITLMQFTGLKDKNGKDIYEGDICKAIYTGSSAMVYKNQIEWNESEYSFSFANAPLWTWEQIEVIGNIYEHPELIKQHL